MSRLTIDAVHTKKQVYPVIINFQNGYPTADFEIDCALVLQGKNSIRTIVTELDELVYAGQEDYKDLGRTFILARDKNTGKVRLIESGSAELKPQNEDNNQLIEKNKLETETSEITSHIQQEIDKVPDGLNCIPVLRECDLEPDMANYLPHEETSFVNPSINNFEQLEIPDSSNSSQLNTDEFVPDRSNSPQNECGELDLNMLFSIAPKHNELESNKYDCAEQDTCESELNITNSHKQLEISKIQKQQMKTNFKETIESETKQLLQVEDKLELDLKKSNLSQPLDTALECDINYTEQLSPGELETGLQIQIEVEVLDLNRQHPEEAGLTEEAGLIGEASLAGEAGLAEQAGLIGEASLAGEAGLAEQAGLIGEASLAGEAGLAEQAGIIGEASLAGEAGLAEQAGLIGDDGLSGGASLTGEASLTEHDGLARETGLIGDDGLAEEASLIGDDGLAVEAGLIGNDGLAGDGGLKLQHEKNKVDSNTAKTLEDQETNICEQNVTSKTQVSDANETEFARLLVEKHSIVPEQANDDENVEKDIDELNFVDSTTELRDGKYNHMMNYFHDELFVPNNSKTNLTNNNEKPKCFNDFSTAKEMFTESLGLKRKVHKKLKTQNVIHKNYMNTLKNYVFITHGHKAIINKQSNDHNKTPNIYSYKYNKQALESQAYTCDYCKNVFEDKDSLIVHLVSHKFIGNTKNVVLKPLVERIAEVANTKNHTCRIGFGNHKKNKKKRNCLDGPENRTSTLISNTVGNSKTTEKFQSFNENNQTINNAKNSPIHFTKDSTNGSETAGNLYICNHCKERFKDKDSLIFHFGTCINSLTPKNVKARKDKSIIIYNDATTNREAHKAEESAAVNTEQTGPVQKLCNEIKIADDFENCPIHLEKDNSRENNESQIIPDRNYVCEHCEKSFEEKGSIIFHLVAHKINNTIEDTAKEDTRKIKYDRTNTVGEKKGLQSSENRIETIEISEYKSKTICDKEIVENVSVNKNSKGVCKNDVETHKTIRIKKIETSNSRINTSHSKDIINSAINVRQLRSSSKNQKHKEIVHNVHDNNISKSARKNIVEATILEKSEAISLNSRINSPQLKDKINGRWLKSLNTNHIEQKHKEILVDICGNSKGVCKKNILIKDKKTSVDNIDKTSPNININASQSKKVLRVLLTPLKIVTNNQKSKKVLLETEPSANNNFICNDCGRVLKSKDTLIAHLESHSKNSKVSNKKNTRKCDTCQSKFATLSELINHEIKLHNTTKAYKSCTLCEYKTLYKSNLADHKRAHLNIKSFKCSYCIKAFGTKSILRRHIRRHKGEKPFKCEICSKAFCVKSDLDLHRITHAKKAFMCTMCRKSFVRATDLKRHMIIHSNKKPFKCATCSSSFSDRSALLSHERKHTGEKPYRYKVLRISA